MRLLGISGSLRRASYNGTLLDAAAAVIECAAVDFVVWRGLADIPAYSEELEGRPPESVTALRHELSIADAVLISTPEYNASVPGALKNALDWASRPFPGNALRGKPVAVIGASQGIFGAVWAQADLRRILQAIGADVDDHGLAVGRAHEAFTAEGRLRDPQHAATLRAIVNGLACAPVARAA